MQQSCKNKKQKAVSAVLSQSKNELAYLIDKVNQLRELNEHLYSILEDPQLAKHCQIANFEDNILVIAVDSANWATRIRYISKDLIDKLSQVQPFHDLKAIRCIIAPIDNR